MARKKRRPRVPSYRRHKPSGQAVVTLSGRDFYLGPHGTKVSRQEYDRVVQEWLAAGRRLPPEGHVNGMPDPTIIELIAAYWQFATGYYVKNGRPTDEQAALKAAFRPLRKLYGHTPAREFTPLRLKAYRESLIDGNRSRKYVNDCVRRIKRAFRWGVENELVQPSVYQSLQAVGGLRRGRSEARETEPVKPVPQNRVKALLPHVSKQVKVMIRLQELTGMRPGEVVAMRGCDLDTTGDLWEYRPAEHKTEHHDRERVIHIGPRAQKTLEPWLRSDLSAYLFQPTEAEAKRNAERRAKRKSKMTPSQAKRRPKRGRRRPPQGQYTADTYRRAIHRACDKAFPPPDDLDTAGVEQWRRDNRWSPNQLRHNRATAIRKRYGVEAARVVLGHASATVTEVYAEMDKGLAAKVAREVG